MHIWEENNTYNNKTTFKLTWMHAIWLGSVARVHICDTSYIIAITFDLLNKSFYQMIIITSIHFTVLLAYYLE